MKTTNQKTTAPRRIMLMILSLMMILTLNATAVFAASAPTLDEVKYEGSGHVEVEFTGKVAWKSPKVTVKDLSGNSYTATIVDKDNDEIEFKIKNFKRNKTYKFTIKGVAKKGTTSYTNVSGKVKIPAAGKIVIEDIEYDKYDKEVEFDFETRVQWYNAKVTITDSNGKNYVTAINGKDRDSLDVEVKGLKEGKTYKYKITGVRKYGTKDYRTLSGSFKAVGD